MPVLRTCPTNVEIVGWVDVRCLDQERRGLKHDVYVNNISFYLTCNEREEKYIVEQHN